MALYSFTQFKMITLFYIVAPKTRTYNGLIGTIWFHNNVSELMTRREANRILAHIGGTLQQVSFNMDNQTLKLISKYQKQVQELVENLERDGAEVTGVEAYDLTKPILSRYENPEAVKAQNEQRQEQAAELAASLVPEPIRFGVLPGIEEEPDEPEHEQPGYQETTGGRKRPPADGFYPLAEDFQFPSYQQMLKELAEADRSDLPFDSKEITGGSTKKPRIQEAYRALFELQEQV